jgi:hypothetical protein
MTNCTFFVDRDKTNEDLKILKGDGRIIIDDKYFLRPGIETNIYKGNIQPLYDLSALNELQIDISVKKNNGFFLTDIKKTEKDLELKFEYEDDFIIFKLKLYKNTIIQIDKCEDLPALFINEYKNTIILVDNCEGLPTLFINELMDKIENKNFDFRIYKEMKFIDSKKRKKSLMGVIKSWINGVRI